MESGLAGLFIVAFVTGLSGAASPGPLLTWNCAAAARYGAWTGPRMVLGHAAVELPLVIALALGLAPFVRQPFLLGVLALVGAVVLVWLAWQTFRSLPSLPDPLALRTSGQPEGGRWRDAFSAGALLSLGNPFWTLWWATVGAGLLTQALVAGALGLAVFFSGHILADFGWYGLVSLAMARGVRYLSRRAYQRLMAGLGLAMALLALWFLVTGVERLLSLAAGTG
jgi:threonine/homoserine/homoserine lactone efflux protein